MSITYEELDKAAKRALVKLNKNSEELIKKLNKRNKEFETNKESSVVSQEDMEKPFDC